MRSYSEFLGKKRVGAIFGQPLAIVLVRAAPGGRSGLLVAGARAMRCAIGRGGISAFKREGDGATPLASMRLLGGYFRPDRFRARAARLPMRPVRPDLGWCDSPCDRNYNRPVRLPYAASHERMLRPDRLYDAVVVLDWNLRPRRRNCGSAIFLHLARPGYPPTEGCVALSASDMAWLLRHSSPRTVLKVAR